jgi:hypothetical protein
MVNFKGPWILDKDFDVVRDQDQNPVSYYVSFPSSLSKKEQLENAKLISAAPEMYSVIKRLADISDRFCDKDKEILLKIVSKVEGK